MEASLASLLNSQIMWLAFFMLILLTGLVTQAKKLDLSRRVAFRVQQLRDLGERLELNVDEAVRVIQGDGTP